MFQAVFLAVQSVSIKNLRFTVLLVGGLAPLISFPTHSSKSHIFSFLFDLVVILHKLIYDLFFKHLTIFLCKKQNSQSYWYAYCSYEVCPKSNETGVIKIVLKNIEIYQSQIPSK